MSCSAALIVGQMTAMDGSMVVCAMFADSERYQSLTNSVPSKKIHLRVFIFWITFASTLLFGATLNKEARCIRGGIHCHWLSQSRWLLLLLGELRCLLQLLLD
jgi:hypothetical protein